MYKVTKKFSFEAAHRLNALPEGHPCRNTHGHSYEVELTVCSNKLNDKGFVIDFSELNEVKKRIQDDWDHAIILSQDDPNLKNFAAIGGKIFILPYNNPSAEHMCERIVDIAKEILYKNYPTKEFKVSVKLYETSNNCAEYTED